jgi:hippurate hydrolase
MIRIGRIQLRSAGVGLNYTSETTENKVNRPFTEEAENTAEAGVPLDERLTYQLAEGGAVDDNANYLNLGKATVDTGGISHRYLYMYVGTADPADVKEARARGMLYPYSNHNPDYKVDLDAIPIGAKIASLSALTFFAMGE